MTWDDMQRLLVSSQPSSSAVTGPLDPPESGPAPACAKDEDCWSYTCCPATQAEQCVHGSRAARCAIIDVSCPKTEVPLFACVCQEGRCAGRPRSSSSGP